MNSKNYPGAIDTPELKKDSHSVREGPSELFENTRRRIFHDVKDVSYFINYQLNLMLKAKDLSDVNKRINFVKDDFQSRIK